MEKHIPVVLLDIAGFDRLEKIPEKRALLKRLEGVIVKALKPFVGRADPRKAFDWHDTGDGFYIPIRDCSPMALRFALDLETVLIADNRAHPDYPLKLRIALTLGDVEAVGQQLLSDAFTEASRLLDDGRVKALLADKEWRRPMVLVVSALFFDDWNNHPDREEADLAVAADLPWTLRQFDIKHDKRLTGYLQVDETVFQAVQVNETATPAGTGVDFTPWLRSKLNEYQWIKIGGIGSGKGMGRQAQPFYPIEELYTVLRSRGTMERTSDETRGTLAEWLPGHARLLITGEAGAGKTTFLHLVFTMLARDHLGRATADGGSWSNRHLGLPEGERARLPLFIKLSWLVAGLKKRKNANRKLLLDYLVSELADDATEPDKKNWRQAWETRLSNGDIMLLLDGLDEVADERDRDHLRLLFLDVMAHWGTCPLVVTSRPFQTNLIQQLKFQPVPIEPFGRAEIGEFLDRWVAVLHGLPPGERPEGGEGNQRQQLEQAILQRAEIRRMAANPVMLTCLCVVHWNEGRLPEGRSRVYQSVITWLRRARQELREAHGFSDRFAETAFQQLALAMMIGGGRGKRATLGKQDAALAVMETVERHYPELAEAERLAKAQAWLAFECIWSGLIEDTGRGEVRFWHLTFQEYLAARQLVQLSNTTDGKPDWWPILQPHLADPQWRETVALFPWCLFDANGDSAVDDLLRRVLEDRTIEGESLVEDARIAGVMGRLLEPQSVYDYRPPPALQQKYRAILDRTLALFNRDGARQVPIKQRIEAAEALGRGGDPRLIDPPLIEVPGTGGWQLGKYPVTVGEYQRFMEHDGYQERSWWCAAGWQERTKKKWQEPDDWDSQSPHPNRPVTGISWFEAMAYCRWLSDRIDQTIRLPDESVWVKAATASRGEYPWGEETPGPELANFDGNVGSPTPVGLYPAGDGPFEHCDLAGNVWEWQRNANQEINPGKTPFDPEVTAGDFRGLRGGAWGYGGADVLRSAFRLRGHAGDRDGLVGFRVAAVPASTVVS